MPSGKSSDVDGALARVKNNYRYIILYLQICLEYILIINNMNLFCSASKHNIEAG